MSELKVGSKLYCPTLNQDLWNEYLIIRDTPSYWIIDVMQFNRVSKDTLKRQFPGHRDQQMYDDKGRQAFIWMCHNKHEIHWLVDKCNDVDVLKLVKHFLKQKEINCEEI